MRCICTLIDYEGRLVDCTDQFKQFFQGPVWDGNLISKRDRSALVQAKLVERARGWNFISKEGVLCAIEDGLLKS